MLKVIFVSAAIFSVATPSFAATYTRTWVSGKGVDSADCGPIASPCRTLQRAYFNTNAGGEVNILDGAGYGALDITKAISVVNDGAGVAGVLASAGSPGISISTTSGDNVILRGLTIEGAGVGSNGIRMQGAGNLTVSNVSIQGFTQTNGDGSIGNGLYIRPSGGSPVISISNVAISDNGNAGIRYRPQGGAGVGKIAIDRTNVSKNLDGIIVDTSIATAQSFAVITNTVASNNSGSGFTFSANNNGGFLRIQMSSSQAGNNTTGIYLTGGSPQLYMSDCTLATNTYTDMTAPNGTTASVTTIGNNMVRDSFGFFTKGTITPF